MKNVRSPESLVTTRPKLAHQQFGSGPDVVLVHGLAANRAFWYPLATALSSQYRVTIYDLRGHGYSERPTSGYTATDQGQDLLHLMDELALEEAAVIGHSYGGAAALEAVLLQPQRFSHLALMDTRIQRLQSELRLHDVGQLTAFEQAAARQDGGDWASEPEVGFRFLEVAARNKVAGVELDAGGEFVPFGEGRGALRAAKQWLGLLDDTSLRQDFRVPGAEAEAYAALRQPTLLMYPSHSRSGATSSRLQALLPNSRLVSLPQAGHFFPVTHPAQVRAEVEALLRSS